MNIEWSLLKHEIAQNAAKSHVAAENDGLGAQKNWFSMESYATRVNVSGRRRKDEWAPDQLAETTKLLDGHHELGLLWAENKATIRNKYFSALS